MSEVELEDQATQEQHNETSADVIPEGTDQPAGETESEAPEEFDIVLAGQEEPTQSPQPRESKDHILNRVLRKKDKLQAETVQLRQQLQQQQIAPAQPSVAAVPAMPDEYAYEDRSVYLADLAKYQQAMMSNAVSQQLNQQQNGHRIAAQEQEKSQALSTYAENAAKLNLPDFNDAQDKAFDILGEDFAQLIAQQLPVKGAKLMYWFGKNPREAAKYRDDFQRNPGQTTFSLGELAANLTVKSKRTKAAQPETRVQSTSVGGGDGSWQREYTKIMDSATPNTIAKATNQIRELKAKARAAGYDVSTLK